MGSESFFSQIIHEIGVIRRDKGDMRCGQKIVNL